MPLANSKRKSTRKRIGNGNGNFDAAYRVLVLGQTCEKAGERGDM
jgi:hypothetical protein